MTSIDIHFCGELLKSAGAALYEILKRGERACSAVELFKQFESANNQAANQIRNELADKYPDIQWSASEFETQKQQKAEFEGECWICDAIDGAVQFLQGIYSYAMSLCLIRNGAPVLSFV